MTDIPLSVIFSWPEPNLEDPETHGDGFLVGNILLAVAGCTAVGMRLWARFTIVRKPGLDDCFITASVITSLGLSISTLLLVYRYGSDRHNWDTSWDWIVPYSLTSWIGFQLYVLNQGLIKISILLLYQNILSRSFSRISQYINWALMVFITFYTLAFYFLNVFQCNPVDAAWARLNLNDPYTKEWTCVDITYTIFLPSIISTVTDFIVAGFPIFFLRQLHLPERQKWLLVLVFGLVFMVCAAGIMRIVSLNKLLYNTYDKTWYGYYHHVWTAIEVWLAIICACAPVLQPLFRKHLGASFELGNVFSASWSKIRNLDISSSRSKQQSSKDSLPHTTCSTMIGTRHNVTLNSEVEDTTLPTVASDSAAFPMRGSVPPKLRPRPPQSLHPLNGTATATTTTTTVTNIVREQPPTVLDDDERRAYDEFRFCDSLVSSGAATPIPTFRADGAVEGAERVRATLINPMAGTGAITEHATGGADARTGVAITSPAPAAFIAYKAEIVTETETEAGTETEKDTDAETAGPPNTEASSPEREERRCGSSTLSGSLAEDGISERVFSEKSFYYP